MYIKSYFSYEDIEKTDKEFKSMLKELISLDTRKLSKLNLLALYGSSSCLKNINYEKELSLYIASHFACINETFKVLKEIKNKNPIMPFDFLNINTNNMGFYLSKALNFLGNSYTISSEFLSFEKAIYTAFLEYKNGINSSFLIGDVDSALKDLPYSKNLSQIQNNLTNDISSWIYFENSSKNSIAKIEDILYFSSFDELNS